MEAVLAPQGEQVTKIKVVLHIDGNGCEDGPMHHYVDPKGKTDQQIKDEALDTLSLGARHHVCDIDIRWNETKVA